MKKLIIGVVVILAAALIGLKYFAAKKQAVDTSPAPGISIEQQGVALPAGSTNYAQPTSMVSYTPAQATGSYEMMALPAAALDLKGACEGGSPKEIMDNHGKTWGYFTGRRNAIDPVKTQDIYNHIWDYYSCTAASRHDSTVCSELPGENVKDAIKYGVPAFNTFKDTVKPGSLMTPMDQCRDKSVVFLFRAYVAGRVKDQQVCMDYISDLETEAQAMIPDHSEFCTAMGQGKEKITSYLKEKIPRALPLTEQIAATSKKSCGQNQECLSSLGVWEGLITGAPAKCPDAYKASCAAVIQKSPAPCSAILADMSKKYCGYYKDLVKLGGGYAGVTPEEVKEALAAAAKKKAEEEQLRKQDEAATKQINEKVRKLMGKKGE